MKKLILIFLYLLINPLTHSLIGQTILDPETFTEQTTLDGDDVWLFSKRSGTWRKVSEQVLKDFIVPQVNLTAIAYVPAPSGNTLNLNKFVKASNSDFYFIDVDGDARLIGRNEADGALIQQMGATDGQSLLWNSTSGEWEPGTVATNGAVPWDSLSNVPAGFADGVDNVDDADADPTNELQAIDTAQLNGTDLELSLGSDGEPLKTIDLSALQDGTGTTINPGDGYLPTRQDSTTFADSPLYANGTDVGIGTASPTEKLEVNGNIKFVPA